MAKQRRTAGGKTGTKNIRANAQGKKQQEASTATPGNKPCRETCAAPGKPLAGAPCEETSKATTLGVEGPDTINNVQEQDLKSTCLVACGSSRRSTTHESKWDQMMKIPSKTLAGDDSKAPGKPCRGQPLGRGQTRARQGFTTSPPLQCDNRHANEAGAYVVACRSSWKLTIAPMQQLVS